MRFVTSLFIFCLAAGLAHPQPCTDYSPPTRFINRALEDPDVYYRSVDLAGLYLYATGVAAVSKPYFSILDVSDPLEPQPLGHVDNTDGSKSGTCVRVSGNYAYIAGSGFRVIDISDRNNPNEIAAIPLPYDGADMFLAGALAFVALYDSGLVALDISSPAVPAVCGSLVLGPWVESVAVDFPYAYVGTLSEVFVVDVSDPANMTVVSSLPVMASEVELAHGYLYTGGSNPHGIDVVDITDPMNLFVVGEAFGEGAEQILVLGGYLFANNNGQVHLYDLSDPTSPVLALRTDMRAAQTSRQTMAAGSGYIYTAGGPDGVGIEVGALGAKDASGGFLDGASGWHATAALRIRGDLAYVGTRGDDPPTYHKLRLFDVSSPSSIFPGGSIDCDAEPAALDGDDAYAYVGLINGDLVAVDVLDVYSPTIVDTLSVGYDFEDLVLDGSHVFTLDRNAGFHVYDVSTPSAMYEVYFTSFAASGSMGGMVIEGDYAYVAWSTDLGPSGLEIVDVSTPSAPVRLSTTDLQFGGERVAVRGGYAFVTYLLGRRLAAVDVSNPMLPTVVDDIGLPFAYENGHDIALDGDLLYFGSDYTGIWVLDVGDPTNLRAAGTIHPPMTTLPWTGHIETANNAVFSSALVGGGRFISHETQCLLVTAADGSTVVPQHAGLHVYPSPFSRIISISVEVTAATYVRLDVYDASGRRIRTLYHGVVRPGTREFVWDGLNDQGGGAASGVYFAHLSSKTGDQTVKLTLLR